MLLFSKIKPKFLSRKIQEPEIRFIPFFNYPRKHGSHSKVPQGLEEAWNNLYAGYVQGVAFALVLQTFLEDEQRAKCEGIVDGP